MYSIVVQVVIVIVIVIVISFVFVWQNEQRNGLVVYLVIVFYAEYRTMPCSSSTHVPHVW